MRVNRDVDMAACDPIAFIIWHFLDSPYRYEDDVAVGSEFNSAERASRVETSLPPPAPGDGGWILAPLDPIDRSFADL